MRNRWSGWWKWMSVGLSPLILVFCGEDSSGPATLDALFVEDDQRWALGEANLVTADETSLWLHRSQTVENLDSGDFSLLVSSATPSSDREDAEGSEEENSTETSVEYVDYFTGALPGGREVKRLATYDVDWVFETSAESPDFVEIFVALKREGYSVKGEESAVDGETRYLVRVGSARFTHSEAQFAGVTFDPRQPFQISQIAPGYIREGNYAIHIPRVWISTRLYQTVCQGATQMPGQLPYQNPYQRSQSCVPAPSESDLCEGQPGRDGCEIQAVSQRMIESVEVFNGVAVDFDGEEADAYLLTETNRKGSLTFHSEKIELGDDDPVSLCDRLFSAVVRSVDNQVNDQACRVEPAVIESSEDGKLACSVNVSFRDLGERHRTSLEHECVVMGVFWSTGEIQRQKVSFRPKT